MKNKLLLAICGLVSAALIPISLIVVNNGKKVSAISSYPSYQLTFDSSNPLTTNKNDSGTKIYKTKNNNDITFSFNNASYEAGAFTALEDNTSYFKNDTAISGIVSLTYSLDSGSIYVFYGWGDTYNNHSSELSNSGTYYFNNEYPSYFKITCDTKSIINTLSITYSCVESVNPYSDLTAPTNPNSPHEYQEKVFVDFPTFTDEDATPGLTYTLSDDGTYYIVDNYNNTMELREDHVLIFPNEHNGLPVKEIGYPGFVERWYIFGIYVPENIVKIQNEAFEMTGLISIYWNAKRCNDFPARNAIFYPGDSHDHQNIDVVFGPAVERVPARMFLPTMMNPTILPKINSVSFCKGSKVSEIGDYAFYGLENLNTLYLPDTITSIGDYAFYGLGVDELALPNSLESIGEAAFMFNSIEHISFPNTLEIVGKQAFNYSKNLMDIDLSSTNVSVINENAFSNSLNINYVSFPNTLTKIDEEAFLNDESLISINLPNSVNFIGKDAFRDCEDVSYIYLGSGLLDISNGAFANLHNATKLIIACESINNFDLGNEIFLNLAKDSDLLVYVKNGVVTLPNNLFYPTSLDTRLPNIKTLVLPNSLTSIGDNAFYNLSIETCEFYGTVSEYNSIVIGNNNDGLSNMKARGN